jgi:hypothetical protein
MGQIQIAESMTKKHWVFDNEFSSAANLKDNSSNEDVASVSQQIKADPNIYRTEAKIQTDKTESRQSTKVNIEVPHAQLRNRFNIFKKKFYTVNNKTWKGVITSVEYPIFKARLYDLDDHSGTYEIADFNIKTDITEQDYELIKVGAIFYWSVGNIKYNKTQTKRSEIRMRRIADITVSEFDTMHDSLNSDYGNIIWE